MKKLKFKHWLIFGDVLTSEELKHVCGGFCSTSGDNGKVCKCSYYEYNSTTEKETHKTETISNIYTEDDCYRECKKKCMYNWSLSVCTPSYN